MADEENGKRTFCVVGSEENFDIFDAKTPRAAAIKALNSVAFADAAAVEVFEIGRGKRYVRQSTAVPAGK